MAPRLEAKQPKRDTEFAAEGRLGHKLAEGILTNDKAKTDEARAELTAAGFDAKELYAAGEAWFRAITNIPDKPSRWLERLSEAELLMSDLAPGMRGFADFLGLYEHAYGDHELTIVVSDLKLGRGVRVSAENNPQLRLYAHAAVTTFSLMGYSFDWQSKVTMQIAQPLVENGFSQVTMPIQELEQWIEKVVKPALYAAHDNPRAVPGPWCRFCAASGVCKAQSQQADKALNVDPAQLTQAELAEWLDKAGELRMFLKAIQDRAYNDLQAGTPVPGYTLGVGRQQRTIGDQEEAISALVAGGYRLSTIAERKLKPLTTLDKVVGKDNLKDILGDNLFLSKGSLTVKRIADEAAKAFPDVAIE